MVNETDSSTGHVAVKSGATVYQVVEAAGDNYYVTIESGATVYDGNGATIESVINSKETATSDKFTAANIEHADCTHANTHIVSDAEHVYEVCDVCGYTVIKVSDGTTTVAKSVTDEIIPMGTYSKEQVSATTTSITASQIIGTGDESEKTGKDVTPSVEESPKTENVDTSCNHVWNTVTNAATCIADGSKVTTCSTCGASYTAVLKATGHNWENDKCTKCDMSMDEYLISINSKYVARIGSVGYEKITDAMTVADNKTVVLLSDISSNISAQKKL